MRIVIAGPEQSGKSCIIKRYCEKRFVAKYLPTVGIDYGATRIFVDKREVSIMVLDRSLGQTFVIFSGFCPYLRHFWSFSVH